MTIKEMESASGISRANIRYYEAEGLLHPARGENGYRDYSEEDLGLLKKIQLCRILGFSLEKIRRMIGGEADLEKTARERVEAIGEERYALQAAERVCRQICEDRASFASMDAERYLGLLREQEKRTEEVELSDRLPVVRAPWRRFFARMTDLEILTALWHFALGAGFHVNLEQRAAGGRILDIVVVMVLMLVIEPVFLHFFGTTPGKWLLGLRVTDPEGERLTYRDAFARTFEVLSMGLGFEIPIYSVIRLYRSYTACDREETLSWEEESELVLKDEKPWRYAAVCACWLALVALMGLGLYAGALPKNRGEISAAQFCENFRGQCTYYRMDYSPYVLLDDGTWTEKEKNEGDVVIDITGMFSNAPSAFSFREENGVLREVSFRIHTEKDLPLLLQAHQGNQIAGTILAFAGAQEEYRPISAKRNKLLKVPEEFMSDDTYRPFGYEEGRLRMSCQRDPEYAGTEEEAYHLIFTLEIGR